MSRAAQRCLWAASAAAFAGCALLPISNPDLFWHLSASRRIFALHAIPTVDWLSFTRVGDPWTDFEWLSQVVYGTLYDAGGFPQLWAFKAVLLAGAALILWKTLELEDVPADHRPAAVALWSAAFLTRSDIRPDLFSVLAFGAVFWALEARRQGRRVRTYAALPLFALWANLHAGFAYGLMLVGIYAAVETARAAASMKALKAAAWYWYALVLAAAGTLLQPFGWKTYKVLWMHGRDVGSLAPYISEWGALSFDNPWHWPAWVVLLGSFAAGALYARRRKDIALAPTAALLLCGATSFQHVRLGSYFATLAVPLAFGWLSRSGVLPATPRVRVRVALASLSAACAAYVFWWGSHFGLFQTAYDDRFAPTGAAAFLERNKDEARGLSLYNPWGWGGYLGWRLYPDYFVFQDGRYIFHSLLIEAAKATGDPAAWQAFLEGRSVDLALMENAPAYVEGTRTHADGTGVRLRRPYYVSFMPKDRWALIYWDEKALLFARRATVDDEWIHAHEYALARPRDDQARADALARNEIDPARLAAELRRHETELRTP
ncbi:MAG: hypothetical protein HY078_00820 [Elusimicrobia bacterium]|nr:hypothetical protein [Elusimicrobiota bacterium]